jgi:hypothetical protein
MNGEMRLRICANGYRNKNLGLLDNQTREALTPGPSPGRRGEIFLYTIAGSSIVTRFGVGKGMLQTEARGVA